MNPGIKAQTGHQRIYDQKGIEDLLGALNVQERRYFKSEILAGAACNTWIEATQEEAAGMASPKTTNCVCLVVGKK